MNQLVKLPLGSLGAPHTATKVTVLLSFDSRVSKVNQANVSA